VGVDEDEGPDVAAVAEVGAGAGFDEAILGFWDGEAGPDADVTVDAEEATSTPVDVLLLPRLVVFDCVCVCVGVCPCPCDFKVDCVSACPCPCP
jgi:hypothetical protein